MKIMICGSMHFAREMLKTQKIIEELGHEVLMPCDVHECVENPGLNMNLEYCIKTNIDKSCFDKVALSDAILVLNHPKNGIAGYIGGATLMEIGIARHLNKKIFLLHEPPAEKDLRYALEIKLAQPVILQGDINKIND
ncbi:hypothetical protein ACFL11_01300 [Patescibacteria group bacterium]